MHSKKGVDIGHRPPPSGFPPLDPPLNREPSQSGQFAINGSSHIEYKKEVLKQA